MAVYRFRIILEDNDDIYRDIEIKSIQTFEDLHVAIQDAFKFDKKHAASFFVSDDYWRKGLEITLREEDLPLEPEEIKAKVEPKKLMNHVKIAKYVESPHQRFVYIFDPNAQWSFLIELFKIDSEKPKTKYPVCVKTNGTAPKQYKPVAVIKEDLSPEAALLAALNEEPDDSEAYKQPLHTDELAVEDDDLVTLEGEEGEETDAESDQEHEDAEGGAFDEHGEEDH